MNLLTLVVIAVAAGSVSDASGHPSAGSRQSSENDLFLLAEKIESIEWNILDAPSPIHSFENANFVTEMVGPLRKDNKDRKWRFEFPRSSLVHSRPRRTPKTYIHNHAAYLKNQQDNVEMNWKGGIQWEDLPPWPVEPEFNPRKVWFDMPALKFRYSDPHWVPTINTNTNDTEVLWKEFWNYVRDFTTQRPDHKYNPYFGQLPNDPRDMVLWWDRANMEISVEIGRKTLPGTTPKPDGDTTTEVTMTTENNYDITTFPPDPDHNDEAHRRRKRKTNGLTDGKFKYRV